MESEYLLCEIQKCYSAVKFWHRGTSTQNQQPIPILQWCASKEKAKPVSWLIALFPKNPGAPLPWRCVPPGGKSSTATQGFPMKQQHKMYMEKKKNQNFGMLWNPELADETLKWLRAAIIVYAPTTIKHQKCVLIRKKEIGQLWFCHLRNKHFPSSQQEQLISLQHYCPGVEINKNHFPTAQVSQEKPKTLENKTKKGSVGVKDVSPHTLSSESWGTFSNSQLRHVTYIILKVNSFSFCPIGI